MVNRVGARIGTKETNREEVAHGPAAKELPDAFQPGGAGGGAAAAHAPETPALSIHTDTARFKAHLSELDDSELIKAVSQFASSLDGRSLCLDITNRQLDALHEVFTSLQSERPQSLFDRFLGGQRHDLAKSIKGVLDTLGNAQGYRARLTSELSGKLGARFYFDHMPDSIIPLVLEGADPEIRFPPRMTPGVGPTLTQGAVLAKRADILKMLLEKGADPKQTFEAMRETMHQSGWNLADAVVSRSLPGDENQSASVLAVLAEKGAEPPQKELVLLKKLLLDLKGEEGEQKGVTIAKHWPDVFDQKFLDMASEDFNQRLAKADNLSDLRYRLQFHVDMYQEAFKQKLLRLKETGQLETHFEQVEQEFNRVAEFIQQAQASMREHSEDESISIAGLLPPFQFEIIYSFYKEDEINDFHKFESFDIDQFKSIPENIRSRLKLMSNRIGAKKHIDAFTSPQTKQVAGGGASAGNGGAEGTKESV